VAVRYQDRHATTAALLVPLPIADGAGGLYSSAEDLFLWDQALYTEQLLPRAELEQMFEPYVPETDIPGFGYGYGWLVGEDQGRPLVAHTGGGPGLVTLIIRYPEDELTEIVLANQGDIDHGSIWGAISNELFGQE
jgi:CubicO group peptidase (beta-lactamase class C family)